MRVWLGRGVGISSLTPQRAGARPPLARARGPYPPSASQRKGGAGPYEGGRLGGVMPLDTSAGVGDALSLCRGSGMPVGLPHSPPPTSGTIVGASDNPDAFRVEAWPRGPFAL